MSRTKGAKDRLPRKSKSRSVSFEQKVAEWEEQEAKVDFKDLCQKLQSALAKSYVENEILEAKLTEQSVVIKYLEGKLNERNSV